MYRENFYDVMGSAGRKIDAIVVPKNSGLKGYVWKTLLEAEFDLQGAKKIGETELLLNGVKVLLKRGEDIPQVVVDGLNQGKFVMGITGDDLFDEFRLRNPKNKLCLVNTYDWDDAKAMYNRPTLCLIGKTANVKDLPDYVRVALNAKYVATSKLFLMKSPKLKGRAIDIVPYSGGLEETVASGAVDCCIDVVYSGATLQRNDLKVMEKIRESDMAVIAPKMPISLLEQLALQIPKGEFILREDS